MEFRLFFIMIVLIRFYCLRCHSHYDYSCYCKILRSKIVFNYVNRINFTGISKCSCFVILLLLWLFIESLIQLLPILWVAEIMSYCFANIKVFILFDRPMLKRAPSLEKCSTVWAPSPLHSMLKMEISSTDSNTENAFCPSEMTFDKSKEM